MSEEGNQPPLEDEGRRELPETSFEPGMPAPGPAWHRASMRPGGEEEAGPPPASAHEAAAAAGRGGPAAPPPRGAETSGTLPPPPSPTGGRLAAGTFLTVGAGSLLAGAIGMLDAQHVGFPANAVGCGIAFVALFLLAVLIRPGAGGEGLRGALGVTSIVFLVACFGFAVDLGSSGGIDGQSLRIKLAAAAALFGLGMAGVGVAVPSAVASGLAVLGVAGAVVLSLVAAGVSTAVQLDVAALVTAVALMLVGLRVAVARPHPTGRAWMVSVAAVVAAPATTALALDFRGLGVAAAAVLVAALALVAWRHRLVVPAIVAVPALVAVEAYVAQQMAGRDSASGQAATVLVLGAGLLLVVAAVALVMRTARPSGAAASGRRVRLEELLLAAVAVLALLSLTETAGSTPGPFLRPIPGAAVSQYTAANGCVPPPAGCRRGTE